MATAMGTNMAAITSPTMAGTVSPIIASVIYPAMVTSSCTTAVPAYSTSIKSSL